MLIDVNSDYELKDVSAEVSKEKHTGLPDGRAASPVGGDAAQAQLSGKILILTGYEAVLEWESRLKELAVRCGQAGAADDLLYHLSTRFAANKVPTLVLIPARCTCERSGPAVEGFAAAVLLFEYKLFGVRSRLFSTSDGTGRRTVIGPESERAALAALACRSLMEAGAGIVLMSLQVAGPEGTTREAFRGVLKGGPTTGTWAVGEREAPLYLALGASYDATLATIGKKTRTQMRYYRRRAEKDLGCTFVPEVKLSRDEFVKVSLEAAFPVEEEIAHWRYESLARIEDPLFCGMQARDGRWLSLAAGRRSHGHVELDWQSNRPDLPAYSLSTVLRAYLIDHEVRRGSTRLYINGTRSSLQRSFVNERIADVTLCRSSLLGWVIRKMAGVLFPERIQLTRVLRDKTIVWWRW